jgi:RHS repeat-associated protein
VRKHSVGIETLTIAGLYERVSPGPSGGTTHRFHIEGPGRVVAEVEWVQRGVDVSQEVRYLHVDRQGSVEIVTGGEPGQVLGRQRFEPYGNMVDPANLAVNRVRPLVAGLRRGFTGHEHDEELGFVDMKGRVYDPRSAAFLSPDPVVAQPQMAHSFHPYSYVTHNPANFTDPTGFQQQTSSVGLDDQEAPGVGEETVEVDTSEDVPGEQLSPTELDGLFGTTFSFSVNVSIHIESVRPDSQTSDDNGSLRQAAPAKNSTVRKRSKVKTGTVRMFRVAFLGDKHSLGCTAGTEGCDEEAGGAAESQGRNTGLNLGNFAAQLRDPLFNVDPNKGRFGLFPQLQNEARLRAIDPVGARSTMGPADLIGLVRGVYGLARGLVGLGRAVVVAKTAVNANRLAGARAVDDFIAQAQAHGMQVVGREVTFNTPFGARRMDVILRNPETGLIGGIEVKSSLGAFNRFDAATRRQFSADWWINKFGAEAVGQYSGLRIDNTIKILWPAP